MNTIQLKKFRIASLCCFFSSVLSLNSQAFADQVINDDLIVEGSTCIGFDCVNGESFGFDTIRLKENNLRIKFQDTSASASFPDNDWQITINDTTNGGLNKFSIDDIDGGRTPFTIEAGAPSNSLYVEDGGHLGLGTSTPVVDIHVVSGNTPTLRLAQDGSSGFGAQTWDMAGNEANFFIRDASNGSTLPFRIFPGAPSNALVVEASGDIGMGTTSPTEDLEIQRSGNVRALLNNTTANAWLWNSHNSGELRLSDVEATPNVEMALDEDGNLTISGSLTTAMNNLPDYVFEPDYGLMPLDELALFVKNEKHLPNIPSASEVKANGGQVDMSKFQHSLLEKVEELTLYVLALKQKIDVLEGNSTVSVPVQINE